MQAGIKNLVVCGLLTVGVGMRVLPYALKEWGVISSLQDPAVYIWNISPVPAMFLLCGAFASRRVLGVVLAMLAYILGDVLIGLVTGEVALAFYKTMPFVYAGLVLHAVMGMVALRKKRGLVRVGLTACASEIVYFLVTNFGDWYVGDSGYPKTPGGLLTCYAMGLPFAYRSFYGTLIFSTIFFKLAEVLELGLTSQDQAAEPVRAVVVDQTRNAA